MKLLLGALLLFAANFAYACPDPMPDNTMCIRWQAPTENVDGSTIPASGVGSLASYRVFYSLTQGQYNVGDSIIVNDPAQTELTTPVDGTITITRPPGGGDVVVYVVMTATNTEAEVSQYSNTVAMTVTFPVPVPGEPVILEAIINVIVT